MLNEFRTRFRIIPDSVILKIHFSISAHHFQPEILSDIQHMGMKIMRLSFYKAVILIILEVTCEMSSIVVINYHLDAIKPPIIANIGFKVF